MTNLPCLAVLALVGLAGCRKDSAPPPPSSSPSIASAAPSAPLPSASSATPTTPTIPDLDLAAVKKTVGCAAKPKLSACHLLDAFADAKAPQPFAAGTTLFFGNSYEAGFDSDGLESMATMRVQNGPTSTSAVVGVYLPADPHAADVTKKLLVTLRAGEPPSGEAKGFIGWLRTQRGTDPMRSLVPTTGTSHALDDPRGAHVFVRVVGARTLVVNYAGGAPLEGAGTHKCMLRIAEVWKI